MFKCNAIFLCSDPQATEELNITESKTGTKHLDNPEPTVILFNAHHRGNAGQVNHCKW